MAEATVDQTEHLNGETIEKRHVFDQGVCLPFLVTVPTDAHLPVTDELPPNYSAVLLNRSIEPKSSFSSIHTEHAHVQSTLPSMERVEPLQREIPRTNPKSVRIVEQHPKPYWESGENSFDRLNRGNSHDYPGQLIIDGSCIDCRSHCEIRR
jgi:hypothetical protein